MVATCALNPPPKWVAAGGIEVFWATLNLLKGVTGPTVRLSRTLSSRKLKISSGIALEALSPLRY